MGEFQRDQCTDLAAALTYYSVLSVFPAILALVSLLGLFGQGETTTEALLDIVRQLGQGQVADQLKGPIDQIVNARGAGLALVVGLAGAIWSASGYVGAFGRSMNRVYQVDEGRPLWKLRPVVLLITVGLIVMAALVLVGLVVSGPVAQAIGEAVGLGEQGVTVWNVLKWPVMLGIVIVMVAVLYYATPNVKQPKFRWVSVGAAVAILVWVLASVAFGFYVSHFSSYNKTYGSLAGVIVFLLWLWITNLALLFGAEVDAELERARELQAGTKAERTIQLPPRDTAGSDKAATKLERKVAEGRDLRLASGSREEDRDADAT
ncbi:MAG TPA: YihY/virulence factor BrkB family protein [Ornithinibacter sp.]|nr:YihY/virulence factor BrkB family protein [Ornithinibacter sp.]